MAKRYTAEFLAAVAALYPHHSRREVADRVNARFGTQVTVNHIKHLAARRGWRQSAATRSAACRLMPPAHVARLRALYATLPASACAAKVNDEFGARYTAVQVQNCLRSYGIRVPAGKANRGQFQHSANSYTPPKGHRFSPATEFQPGHNGVPSRRTPIGHERMSATGLLVKVAQTNPYTGAPSRYVRKARWVWEQAHGAIPPGSMVVQVDGDPANCDLDNLVLLTRAEMLALNHKDAPPPSRDPGVNRARITLARLQAAIHRGRETTRKEAT